MMPNRLASESSPYLLQHANNPVDWYPWGPEALERSRREGRPIFLSIGYSACHWCHVMEHESFEDPRIAALLNERFVCIKVDREERPDLDHIYMQAVQAMTGRGGWPMSVFLTPDLQPFFGGTYWPPTARGGMPGFDQVAVGVAEAWTNRRAQALDQAARMAEYLQETHATPPADGKGVPLDEALLLQAARGLERNFDPVHGGFGGAPKFPHPMDISLLLRLELRQPDVDRRHAALHTLRCMAQGGIYDHLGGGFHRYSVDERWLVPHFEKMLYDNALLASAFLDAYLLTGEDAFAQVVRETCDYVLRRMTDARGGFYSTEDADSEGIEGKYYVWSQAEVTQILGPDPATLFCYVYDVTPRGNFEGHNILHLTKTWDQVAALKHKSVAELQTEMAACRQALLAVRETRVPPGLDDKVIVSWNGLFLDTLSRAAFALNDERYLQAAAQAATFLLRECRLPSGQLAHGWRNGQAKGTAFVDDFACLANGLISLFMADGNPSWITAAQELLSQVTSRFADAAVGGFYYTPDDHEQLVSRPKDSQDSSVPSGNGMAATALIRLGLLLGDPALVEQGERAIQCLGELLRKHPAAFGQHLLAVDLLAGSPLQLCLVAHNSQQAEEFSTAVTPLRRKLRPRLSLIRHRAKTDLPAPNHGGPAPALSPMQALVADKPGSAQGLTLYVCQGWSCQQPVVGLDAIVQTLEAL